MLTLRRKQGESIQIGDDVFVTVAGVIAGNVTLSIDAPRSVPIVRTELLDRDTRSLPTHRKEKQA